MKTILTGTSHSYRYRVFTLPIDDSPDCKWLAYGVVHLPGSHPRAEGLDEVPRLPCKHSDYREKTTCDMIGSAFHNEEPLGAGACGALFNDEGAWLLVKSTHRLDHVALVPDVLALCELLSVEQQTVNQNK